MFSIHTTLKKLENTMITSHFGFVFEENLSGEISCYCNLIVFKTLVFCPYENAKPNSNFKFLQFEEPFCLCDKLVFTESLTREIKLRF